MEIRLDTISQREVLQYLGWRGCGIDERTGSLLDACIKAVTEQCTPRCVYRVFETDPADRGSLKNAGISFEGTDIRRLLAESDRCAVFAATLGLSYERLHRAWELRDAAGGVIMDACGSAAIERVCDLMEEKILSAEGGYLTDRFSPGYGDMPLTEQKKLFALTAAEKYAGITLTDSCMMIPQKSVTGIIGFAKEPQKKRFRGCAYCNMFENCAYRKAGRTCGRT